MTFLLDTCTMLWLASEHRSLSQRARQLLAGEGAVLCISAISVWEIAWKQRKGKLSLPLPTESWISLAVGNHGLRVVPIDQPIALTAAQLPEHHKDPCDRLLIATAHVKGLTIITPDPEIHRYESVKVEW